jgi:hypothetical protein
MVGNHPTIGQVNVFLKLYREHFCVDLYHNAFEPIMDSFSVLVMVAHHFYSFSYFKRLVPIGCRCKM